MRAKVLNGLIIRMERATVVSPGTPRRCLGLPPAGLAQSFREVRRLARRTVRGERVGTGWFSARGCCCWGVTPADWLTEAGGHRQLALLFTGYDEKSNLSSHFELEE